ncbi:hypothetical protein SPRG_02743 [Saprolegnia parasitica CBS 223.65]|uniref:Methyltransferase domain-containing protein n=1 Tax=Saprolegnia parasitica (strain CBS 223.65) TaxID=695850 RepID=A0A067CNL3_SAPPC|nr:hypothetical protein SPRG_02743 [Saprolegnia parasitica CBS 223.65]KDO32264.1 hypothetical protein SPRG_02743 [Saprolegnia parasitica CBS 223.65]|eukprot:XP_012196720.1 hypothetical protein SPRG_02743 [Saprolegnia parasitica CBS 223.65]
MQVPPSLASLIRDKDVLVLNAGKTALMQPLLDPARSIRVVDSRGLTWHAVKPAQFVRGNPLAVALDQPVDLVWSNMDWSSAADDDVLTFLEYVSKLALHVVHAYDPSIDAPAIAFLSKQLGIAPLTLHPTLAVLVPGAPAPDSNVVAVWSDRKMPLIWRDSVYANKCAIMAELYEAQKTYIQSLLPSHSSYVEVGCGTSEMGSVLFEKHATYTVGVEINPIMLELAREMHPAMAAHPRNYLLEGNALELRSLLRDTMPADFWTTKRVVAIVMNTFGILPAHIRQGVVDQMLEVAGEDGVVVIGCWHADSFRRGVEEYYMKNPDLVGDHVTHAMCDYTKAQLFVPSSKYESHWWSEDELRGFVRHAIGVHVDVHVAGIGIFLTCRRQ